MSGARTTIARARGGWQPGFGRIAAGIALLAFAGVLAGCGGSSNTPPTPTVAVSAMSQTDVRAAVKKLGKTACNFDGMDTAGFLAALENAKFVYNTREQLWEADLERRRIQYSPGTSTSPSTINCFTTSAAYKNGTAPD